MHECLDLGRYGTNNLAVPDHVVLGHIAKFMRAGINCLFCHCRFLSPKPGGEVFQFYAAGAVLAGTAAATAGVAAVSVALLASSAAAASTIAGSTLPAPAMASCSFCVRSATVSYTHL